MDTADYLLLSELNDFIFCPRSIFYHHIYGRFENKIYHETDQIRGSQVHESVDKAKYSTSKHILQGIPIISHEFGIQGKIDIYNTKTGILTERKRHIKKIYRGYEWQLYGQYFCLTEMGYVVTGLEFYSFVDNKKYKIPLPSTDDREKFGKMIEKFKNFSLNSDFVINPNKCARCIYKNLCDKNPLL